MRERREALLARPQDLDELVQLGTRKAREVGGADHGRGPRGDEAVASAGPPRWPRDPRDGRAGSPAPSRPRGPPRTRSASRSRRSAPGEPPFEGPLDLLLHLVKEHQVDLFDIPIARITESYLATLEALRELDIDVAGEFLHMAAQLMLMKSRLLLPRTEVAEDAPRAEDAGVDPARRARAAAARVPEVQGGRGGARVARHPRPDVFVRRARPSGSRAPEGPEGLADVSVFKLIEALDRALANASPRARARGPHRPAHHQRRHRAASPRCCGSSGAPRFEELLAGPAERRHDRVGGDRHLPRDPRDGEAEARPHLPGAPRRRGARRGDPRRGARHARRRRARADRRTTDEREFRRPAHPERSARGPSAEPGAGGARRRAAGGARPGRGQRQELEALQAAEEAKGDPGPRRGRVRRDRRPPTRRRSRSRSSPPPPGGSREERVRTVVETLLFLAERPLARRGAPAGDRRRGRPAREGARPALRPLPRGVCGIVLHEVAGGWQLRTSPGQLRLRAPLPAGEAAAAHPRRARDARDHRLPPAGHPPGDRGDPRRGLRRGGEGAARAAAHQDPRQEGGAGPADPLRHHPRVPRVLRAEGPRLAPDAARVPRALRGAPRHRREAARAAAPSRSPGSSRSSRDEKLRAELEAKRAESDAALEELERAMEPADEKAPRRRRPRSRRSRRTPTTEPGGRRARRRDARGHAMSRAVRLQKFLAAAGVASRRKAEELILAGRVKVNARDRHASSARRSSRAATSSRWTASSSRATRRARTTCSTSRRAASPPRRIPRGARPRSSTCAA